MYWSTERLAKSQLIPKLYKKKCLCCNANVPETIEHILLGCGRWAAIFTETIDKYILRLYKLAINNNNQPLMQAKMQLSKKSLLQLRNEKKPNMPPSMELETAKFIYCIHVAWTLILNGIKCSPTPLSRCPEVVNGAKESIEYSSNIPEMYETPLTLYKDKKSSTMLSFPAICRISALNSDNSCNHLVALRKLDRGNNRQCFSSTLKAISLGLLEAS
ncbi:hypothetical protein BB561_006623 [Smittium simulii]|uniref:Uncharacterized protein n=1 Tax=Smittium simulii TaxID=133385 RepID=A0A2T9Y2T1_9FUNG|nr:hypothetical protein BB561_006623 [Smittium simulii]